MIKSGYFPIEVVLDDNSRVIVNLANVEYVDKLDDDYKVKLYFVSGLELVVTNIPWDAWIRDCYTWVDS